MLSAHPSLPRQLAGAARLSELTDQVEVVRSTLSKAAGDRARKNGENAELQRQVEERKARQARAEQKLKDAGVGIGRRVLELASLREKANKRETRMLGILQFLTGTVWKQLFGASADSLEKAVGQEDEFMIVERAPLVNTYISAAPCNCAAFVAGIVTGVLDAANFPARVSAHEYEDGRTCILIKFAAEVIQREKRQQAD